MKKMSRGEQIKSLRSKRRTLLEKRDLSMEGRMAAQQAAQQAAVQQAAQNQKEIRKLVYVR